MFGQVLLCEALRSTSLGLMVAMIQAASILRSRPTAKDEWAPPNCLTVAGTATLGPILSGTIKRLRCARRGRALVLPAGHQTDAEKNGEVYVFIENQWDCKEVQVFNRCRDGNVGSNPFWHNQTPSLRSARIPAI